jgi:hypothetical protein
LAGKRENLFYKSTQNNTINYPLKALNIKGDNPLINYDERLTKAW